MLALEHHDRLARKPSAAGVVACVVPSTRTAVCRRAEPDGQRLCFAVQRAVFRISAQECPARLRQPGSRRQHDAACIRHREVSTPHESSSLLPACGARRRRQAGSNEPASTRTCTVHTRPPQGAALCRKRGRARPQSCKKAQRCKSRAPARPAPSTASPPPSAAEKISRICPHHARTPKRSRRQQRCAIHQRE